MRNINEQCYYSNQFSLKVQKVQIACCFKVVFKMKNIKKEIDSNSWPLKFKVQVKWKFSLQRQTLIIIDIKSKIFKDVFQTFKASSNLKTNTLKRIYEKCWFKHSSDIKLRSVTFKRIKWWILIISINLWKSQIAKTIKY